METKNIKSPVQQKVLIMRNYKEMSEEEMEEALSKLCELVKQRMVDEVENALHFMKNKQY